MRTKPEDIARVSKAAWEHELKDSGGDVKFILKAKAAMEALGVKPPASPTGEKPPK